MPRALGLVLGAALVAACGPPAGTLYKTTLTTADGSYPMPVTLGDTTGLVTSMQPGVPDPFTQTPSVSVDPGDPSVLVVSWLGGMCEDETVLGFWPDAEGYGMYVATRGGPGLFGGCPAAGIVRVIRITLSSPIAADKIVLTDST